MAKPPVLDDRAVSRLCVALLDRLRIDIVLCSADDEVVYATRRAKEILRRFGDGAPFRTGQRLPAAVREAARTYLLRHDQSPPPRRVPPIALTAPDGAAHVAVSCLAVAELPPVALVVRLTEERVELAEVLDAMRARHRLSARDQRLIRSVVETRSVREIAAANALTYGTTKVYLHDLYRRLGVHSRDDLLRLVDRVRRGR